MTADEQIKRLNEPRAGFQVREIADENASAFELKLITRPIKVGGRAEAGCGAERPDQTCRNGTTGNDPHTSNQIRQHICRI